MKLSTANRKGRNKARRAATTAERRRRSRKAFKRIMTGPVCDFLTVDIGRSVDIRPLEGVTFPSPESWARAGRLTKDATDARQNEGTD